MLTGVKIRRGQQQARDHRALHNAMHAHDAQHARERRHSIEQSMHVAEQRRRAVESHSAAGSDSDVQLSDSDGRRSGANHSVSKVPGLPDGGGTAPSLHVSNSKWQVLSTSFKKKPSLGGIATDVIRRQQRKHGLLIHPESGFKVAWDIVISLFIVYSCLSVPFRIGFNEEAVGFFKGLDTLVDISFGLDILFSFRTAYYDSKDTLQWGSCKIASHYLRGGFALDIVSTVPFDFLLKAAITGNSALLRSTKLLRALRLIRLLRLMRLIKLGKFFSRFSEDVTVNQSFLQLGKMSGVIGVCGHLLACAWYWVSQFGDGPNWVEVNGVDEMTLRKKYVVSLYWAFTTMTTVGYGDVNAVNTAERVMALFAMLVGASIFGYVVGNVTMVVESINQQATLRKEKLDSVKEFVRERRLPPYLAKKVKKHFKYFYAKKSVFDESTMLDNMPSCLRGTISQFNNEQLIERTPLLDHASPMIVSTLLTAMRPFTLPPRHCIYCQGDVGVELMLVLTGDVALLWDPSKVEGVESLESKQGRPLNKYERRLGNIMRAFKRRRVQPSMDEKRRASAAPMECGEPVTDDQLYGHIQVQLVHRGGHFGQESAFEADQRLCTAITASMVEVGCFKKDDLYACWPEAMQMLNDEAKKTRDRIDFYRNECIAQNQAAKAAKTATVHEAYDPAAHGAPPGMAVVSGSEDTSPARTPEMTPRGHGATMGSMVHSNDSDSKRSPNPDEAHGGSGGSDMLVEDMDAAPPSDNTGAGVKRRDDDKSSGAGAEARLPGRIMDGPDAGAGGGGDADAGAGGSRRISGASTAGSGVGAARSHSPSSQRSGSAATLSSLPPYLRPSPPPGAPPHDSMMSTTSSARSYQMPADVSLETTHERLLEFVDPMLVRERRSTEGLMLHTDSWQSLKRNAPGSPQGSRLDLDLDLGADFTQSGHLGTAPPKIGRRVIQVLDAPQEGRASWCKRHTVHPHAPMRLRWDLLLTIIILYSAVIVPYRIGFGVDSEGAWLYIDICTDILFGMDIVFNLFTGYISDLGNCVREPRLIIRNYMRGWFAIDFFSTVPFDLFMAMVFSSSDSSQFRLTKLLRTLRLFRLLKLARFIKLEKLFGHYEDVLSIHPSIVRMVKLAVTMFFIAHINGCLWFGISGGLDDDTWPNNVCDPNQCISEMDRGDQYMASVYWAFTTMTTVGYGDITPSKLSKTEMVVAMLSMVLGTTVFAHVITAVMGMVINFDPAQRQTKQALVQLNDYMKEKRLPTAFRRQLRDHYKHFLEVTSVLAQTPGLYDQMPTHLRIAVVKKCFQHNLYTIPLLKRCEAHFHGLIAQLALLMKPARIAKGAVVVRLNDTQRNLFFVVSGLVHVYDPNGKLLRTAVDGQFFGESALWTSDSIAYRSKIMARAGFITHLFYLSRGDFLQLRMSICAAAATYLEHRLKSEGSVQEWASRGEEESDDDGTGEGASPGAPGPGGAAGAGTTKRPKGKGRGKKRGPKMGKFR